MSEAFAKSLASCRKIHLWTGFLNILVMLLSGLVVAGAYVLTKWVPQLIDSDLYTDEQREQYRQNIQYFQYLDAMLWVLVAFFFATILLVFLAFHVWWCLGRGRFYGYCVAASWLQSLNAPVGTPAGATALKLLWSDEGKAHFGRPVQGAVLDGKDEEKPDDGKLQD